MSHHQSGLSRRGFLGGTAASLCLGFAAPALAAEEKRQVLGYTAPYLERELPDSTLVDLEKEAARVLRPGAFASISGGAEKGWTARENVRAFSDWNIIPDYLAGKAAPETAVTLLGQSIALPVITAPMGTHALAHNAAELGTAVGTNAAGTIMTLSTAANTRLEDVAAVDGIKWFQIYLLENDRSGTRSLLRRARAAGFQAIVFTIDAFAPGRSDALERSSATLPRNLPRPHSGEAGFQRSLSWNDVDFILDTVDLPLIIKGVLTPELAEKAIERGASAIQVSNHGGRQLDSLPPAISVLPDIARAVDNRVPIIFDSGIRRGTDVFKALALGADAVALGRPVLYGLALGGSHGVSSVYQRINRELTHAMTMAGVASCRDIKPGFLRRRTTGQTPS